MKCLGKDFPKNWSVSYLRLSKFCLRDASFYMFLWSLGDESIKLHSRGYLIPVAMALMEGQPKKDLRMC